MIIESWIFKDEKTSMEFAASATHTLFPLFVEEVSVGLPWKSDGRSTDAPVYVSEG